MSRPLHTLTTAALTSLFALPCPAVLAEQTARMTVTVTATGEDATKSQGEWSKGTFSYRAHFSADLQTDGAPTSVNMHDPEYAQKAMAQAQRDMTKIQNAMQGKFSDEEETAPDERFLLYTGQLDCPASLTIDVNEKVEGAYADVGGMQPYTQTFTGKSAGTKDELNMLCVGNSSTLDMKDSILYRSNVSFPGLTGHYIFTEANRGARQDDAHAQHNALPKIVSELVFNTLRVAPTKGSKHLTLTPTEPVVGRVGVYENYTGKLEVDIEWDFVPAK